MLPSYVAFKGEIEQIEHYMQSIRCYNQILNLDISKSEAMYKDKIIDLQNISRGFNKRKYDYAVVIVSLYGCFEQFVENYVKDYLMILVDECEEYSKLPAIIVNNHIDLSVELMGKIEQSKYCDFLSKEQIIRNLNDCIQHNKCSINYEAFCQHTANFRVQTIGEVLKNVGLTDVINSIKRNEELKELYIQQNGECNYEGLKLDIIFSFLNELADRRNRIAHGSVTDILSYDLQLQMIKKVKLFGQEMDKIGFEKILPYVTNKAYRINEIYNPNKLTKLLCFKIEGIMISIGDVIIKKHCEKFTYCKIESIEVDHIKYTQYEAKDAVDIGVMLDKQRKNDEEYWIYSVIGD